MNDTQSSNTPGTANEGCCAMRCQLNTVLVLLIVVIATIALFFGYQIHTSRKDKAAWGPVVAEYDTKTAPRLKELAHRLQEYAKTHPDLTPILTKYGLGQPGTVPPQGSQPK
jgi:hypothetical protein